MHNPTLLAIVVTSAIVFVSTPALIAFARNHPERTTIVRLSVFALFSFVLWAALLTWAVSDKRDDGVIARYVARLRQRKLLPVIVGVLVVIGAVVSAVTLLR